jgi:hypothetical protein
VSEDDNEAEKNAAPATPAPSQPRPGNPKISKPKLRGVFKFKTWEEKEEWEKIQREAGLL